MKGLRERLQEKAAASQLEDADPTVLRDYYQSVLDSVGSVVYTVNRELRITGVNEQWDAFARANGGAHLTRAHILGSSLLDQMRGAPLNRWRTVCQQILDGELARYLDEVASEAPFAWRHYSLRATPLRDGRGEILGITFVATNITQLKKAEHEMFQRLVEIRGLRQVAQTTGSWVDRRRVFKQVTTDIAHLFGAEKCVIFLWDEKTGNLQAREPAFGLAGRKLADLSLDMGHPADPNSLWLDLEEKEYILLNEGDEAPADMVETSAQVDRLAAILGILRVSGRILGAILVAGRDRPFSDQDGQLLALFAVPTALSIENTELNRRLLDRAQQLATARDELDRVIKMKEEVSLPLSVIRGYMELLLEGAMGAVPEAQLPTIRMVLDKTQAVIDLLERISPPRFPRDADRYERVNLGDLMRSALDRHRAAIEKARISLVTQLPGARDKACVTMGDPDMLFQVFDGLLDNAITFSGDSGRVYVSVDVSEDTIYVKIVDSGTGIPANELLHIWKSQKHSGPSTTADLAEVKRIVEGHGGQVWAESIYGQGNTFHVVLRRLDDRSTRAG